MDRAQAAALIQALNKVAMYVPPIIWDSVVAQPALNTLEAIANGVIELGVRPPVVEGPPQPPGG